MSALALSRIAPIVKSSFLAVVVLCPSVSQSARILIDLVSVSVLRVVSLLGSLKDERSGLCHCSASSRHSSVSQDVQCLGVSVFRFANVRCI